MKRMRAYKVELAPNNTQKTALLRHCGAARFVYNWGLNAKIEARKGGEKPLSAQKLDGVLRSIMDEEFPWMREVSSQCRQGALANLEAAYKNFFTRCKKGKKGRATGFPKFKSRKNGLGGFVVFGYTITNDSVKISRVGTVRLKEKGYLPIGGYGKNSDTVRFYGARVSERAGRWFLSVQVEVEAPEPDQKSERIVGIDFGVKTLAVCSDGTTFQSPKALKANLKRLARAQRSMSRKIEAAKKSGRALRECKNFQKSKTRVAKIHARVADLRRHNLHHVSHVLTRKSSVLCIEDLNVAGMVKNRHLARAISDLGFGELRRQIEYKSEWRGVEVVIANRWFPSSKTCNACGLVNQELQLKDREWKCECGERHDRDLNAAYNLRDLAANRAVSDCGGKSSGDALARRETIPCEAVSGLETLVSISPAPTENSSIPVWAVGKNGQLRWC